MCGIVGVAASRPLADSVPLVRMRDALRHRGPDEEGLWWSADGRCGLGHRRLADPRPLADGAPADGRRQRHPAPQLQRRDLQPPRAALRARGQGPSLPRRKRQRGAARGVSRVGHGLRRALRRHVRLRAPRRGARPALPRARPDRREAALPAARRGRAGVRLRVEGAARRQLVPAPARPALARLLSRLRLRAGLALDAAGLRQAATGARARLRAEPRPRAHLELLEPARAVAPGAARARRPRAGAGRARAARSAALRVRAPAARGGRAGRDPAERRHRLEPGRRAGGACLPLARADLHGQLSRRRRARRGPLRADRRPAARDRARRSRRGARLAGPAAGAGAPIRRADGRLVAGPELPALARRAAARQGGARR